MYLNEWDRLLNDEIGGTIEIFDTSFMIHDGFLLLTYDHQYASRIYFDQVSITKWHQTLIDLGTVDTLILINSNLTTIFNVSRACYIIPTNQSRLSAECEPSRQFLTTSGQVFLYIFYLYF